MSMGRRSGRAAARRAAAALESTPRGFDIIDDDELMPDASSEPEAQPEPEDEKAEASGDEEEAANEEEPEEESEPSVKEPTPPPVAVIRRKRLGRPPKNRPPDWDNMIEVPVDENTPRRRGRGGWRGRGGRKPGPGQVAIKQQQNIDKEGTVADIVNDECVLPEDPIGETKVDKNGVLQGDREYRCRTFTVLGRGNRLYMLSTEPARCVGFRDSYLFFTKHLKLYKIIVDDEEKRDMIERDIIPHSYKGRAIGIVTARSVFREFGARMVVGGKRIIDDYAVAEYRAEGVVEGELADPNDIFNPNEPYNKNQYVAWHGASAVYHTNVPSVPDPTGKVESKKRRVNVNNTNWMLEHAREASNYNTSINSFRRLTLNGVYDIHTNLMQYPSSMQPTHARIEQAGIDEVDGVSTTFPKLQPKLARNFMVTDTYYETPPAGLSAAVYEKTDPADFLAPFNGLSAVSDDIRSLLPPECRQAFDTAVTNEQDWKSRWGNEKDTMSRRQPIIDKAVVPYSKS